MWGKLVKRLEGTDTLDAVVAHYRALKSRFTRLQGDYDELHEQHTKLVESSTMVARERRNAITQLAVEYISQVKRLGAEDELTRLAGLLHPEIEPKATIRATVLRIAERVVTTNERDFDSVVDAMKAELNGRPLAPKPVIRPGEGNIVHLKFGPQPPQKTPRGFGQ